MPYKGRTTEVFYAAGRGGQYIFVVPESDLVCVVTAGNYDSDPVPSEDFFKAYILGAFK
jgi:CubicO group peptidase (beta-lactamase class C family)